MEPLKSIDSRLTKIEINQERFTETLERIEPIIQDYHTEKLMKQKIISGIKFISLTLGTIAVAASLFSTYWK